MSFRQCTKKLSSYLHTYKDDSVEVLGVIKLTKEIGESVFTRPLSLA